ncbi:hypothetical protein ACFXA3_00255 [Streptomyces sp. NPDC059456]|jgi:hypothetical protein|uniref:hypothetical protein n=1 Tax=Streptomyces sp. NPDC059456 TaxID=3346838 RepID=UPI0036A4BFC8
MTADEAIGHAARLLAQAELELTNLPLIERLDQLACSWLAVANLLNERERV